jgi:hypothetical protein
MEGNVGSNNKLDLATCVSTWLKQTHSKLEVFIESNDSGKNFYVQLKDGKILDSTNTKFAKMTYPHFDLLEDGNLDFCCFDRIPRSIKSSGIPKLYPADPEYLEKLVKFLNKVSDAK